MMAKSTHNPQPTTDNPQRIRLNITRESAIVQTPRVMQMSGMFDVPPSKRSVQTWKHDFTLPAEWNVGVIVGPSGAGKTTLAKEAFGSQLISGWDWPADKCILDGFPAAMGAREITGLLSSVGFSSPPSWMRPFHVLSNGEQFRVNVARTLAETQPGAIAVVDEFTSVVDRTVAQIGSAAVQKAVRRRQQKFVAVACHYDILDWLEPDWVYEPHIGRLTLNHAAKAARGSLRRLEGIESCGSLAIQESISGDVRNSTSAVYNRPKIELVIQRVDSSAWKLFKHHHYLSSDLHKCAACYLGLINDRPAAFVAVLSFPHPIKPAWREHRAVCLPDFQGVGIGNAMSEFVASLYAAHKPYISCTSHPAMIRHRIKSPLWRMTRKPSMVSGKHQGLAHGAQASFGRITAGFEYRGPVRKEDAAAFGLAVKK
jgi:ABC-type thiamine transport system ATPase subunit